MLDLIARVQNYQDQTGGRVTKRQARRIRHKENRQKPEAASVREAKSAKRAAVREARKKRLAGLLGR